MKNKGLGESLIEIVIPNWNGAQMLSHCLQSLNEQTYKDFSVTVVDNGSADDSLEIIESVFPNAKIIKFDHNRGFSVAVNEGIKATNAPWILLLNNDMEVAPNCLQQLAASVEEHSEYDYFALKMMSFSERDTIDGAGDGVLRGGVGYRLGTMEKDSERYAADRPTFGACAGAALYKSEVFDRVGLFDSGFFAYLEDVDLNFRAARLGMRCMYLNQAVVFHIGSATTGSKINPTTIRLSTRNNLFLLFKNYPLRLLLRFLLPIKIYQLMWLIFCLKKKMIKPYLQGVFEAVFGLKSFASKRRMILGSESNISVKDFGDMIASSEKEVVESIMARRTGVGKTNKLLSAYCRLFLHKQRKRSLSAADYDNRP